MLRGLKLPSLSRLAFLIGGLVALLVIASMLWAGLTAPLSSRLPFVSPDGKYFGYFDFVEKGSSEEADSYDLIVSTPRGRMMGRFRIHAGSVQWSNAGHLAVIDEKRTEAKLIVNTADRLLVLAQIQLSPGKEPRWSHDGNKLAFVRPVAADEQLAIYDVQQAAAFPIPVPPEFHLRRARLLFWSPGSDFLYFLNEEGQDVVLDRLDVQSGKIQVVARGFVPGKGTAPGLPSMSPDGTKVYLPPPRNCVIDAESGEALWTLPEGAEVLWSAWSGDGRQFFYFRPSDPAVILAHDFISPIDQAVVSGVRPNGTFTADGRNYFFRAPQEFAPNGRVESVRAWLRGSWGWQQAEQLGATGHPLGRMEFWPWEQTLEGGIVARQDDYTEVRFGLYEPDGRLFDEFVFPTAGEDLFRQLRAHRLILLTVAFYALMALVVYWKGPATAARRAFYILTTLLIVLFVSQFLQGAASSVKPHMPFRVTPGEIQWLGSGTTSPLAELIIEVTGFIAILLWALLPAALINLAIVFLPENRLFVQRNPLRMAVYGVATLPLVGVLAAPRSAYPLTSPVLGLLVLAGLTAATVWVLTLVFNYRQVSDKRSRGQVRWMALAFGLGLGGALALLLARGLERWFTGDELPSVLRTLRAAGQVLAVWVAPTAVAYAVTAQKPYRLRLLARRIVRQALMALPVLLVFLLLLAAVSWLVTGSFITLSPPIVALAVIMAILLAMPFRGRLRVFVDRTFDREAFEFRENFLDFARGLPHILDRRTLVTALEETLPKAMGAKWHYFFVLNRGAKKLRLQPGKASMPGGVVGVEFDPDEPLCQYLLAKERPFEVEVSPYSPELVPVFRSAADRLGKLHAAVIVGLKRRHELLGLLAMGNKTSGDFYDAEDLELLMTVTRKAASAVENIDLFDEAARDREMQKELEDASEVQAQLFPADTPRLQTGQVTGRCIPARSACGDFYDFLELPGCKTGIAIGDVSGKGMAASLLMANVQGLLRTQAPTAATLGHLVRKINQHLYGSSQGAKFCSLFFGVYDDARRRLEFFNAGYCPPLVVTAEGVRFLEATGLPLGLFPEITHRPQTEVLAPGTLLVFYSNGVTEARDSRGEYYGIDRLVSSVTRAREEDADRVMAKILADVRDFEGGIPLDDDQTLIVLKINEA